MKPRVGVMLWRNSVVSCAAFVMSISILWALVTSGLTEIWSAAIGFIAANSLHYFLGRSWIFKGAARSWSAGYAFFLSNAVVGLTVTLLLYAAFLNFTSVNYLIARVIVSLVAGLLVFLLNGMLNFKQF